MNQTLHYIPHQKEESHHSICFAVHHCYTKIWPLTLIKFTSLPRVQVCDHDWPVLESHLAALHGQAGHGEAEPQPVHLQPGGVHLPPLPPGSRHQGAITGLLFCATRDNCQIGARAIKLIALFNSAHCHNITGAILTKLIVRVAIKQSELCNSPNQWMILITAKVDTIQWRVVKQS